MASDYYPTTPYAYCSADPINRIDPTGMEWQNEKDKQYLLDILNRRLNNLYKQIDNVTNERNKRAEENKSTEAQDKQLADLNRQVGYVNQAISDVNTLDEDPNNTYALMEIDNGDSHKVVKTNGIVYIQYSDEALIFHEAAHIRQNLEHIGELKYANGYEMISSKQTYQGQSKNEIESYRIQYSINCFSLPNSVGSINEINLEYLTRIWTPDRRPAYGFAFKLIEILKKANIPKNEWP